MPKKKDVEWRCKDCGETEFDLFMVKDEIWTKIWPTYVKDMQAIKDPKKRHGVLCQPCSEKRLGRPLTKKDMTEDGLWLDPAGVPDTWAGEIGINVNVEDVLKKAPEDLAQRARDRYLLVRPAAKSDKDDMKALVKLGLPCKTVERLYHRKITQAE